MLASPSLRIPGYQQSPTASLLARLPNKTIDHNYPVAPMTPSQHHLKPYSARSVCSGMSQTDSHIPFESKKLGLAPVPSQILDIKNAASKIKA